MKMCDCRCCCCYECDPDYVPFSGLPPFVIYGCWKPNRIVKIRLGRKAEMTVKTNKEGQFVSDLNNFPAGYKGYKYVYVNNKRFKLNLKKGGLRIDFKDGKKEKS